MRCVLLLWAGFLVGCDQTRSERLPQESYRPEAQRARCVASAMTACAPAEAYRHRFFDGKDGPDAFGALELLPPIPPTFVAPLDADPDRSRGMLSRQRAAHE
jgi:hypothetical protein